MANITSKQIELVQQSLQILLPKAIAVGKLFYEKLFEEAPDIEALFHTAPEEQSRKLMTVMIHIMANLDQLSSISQELKDLAHRHVHYQVTPAHYEIMGTVFIDTLKNCMPTQWTGGHQEAWEKAYNIIANAMLDAYDK